MAQKSPKLLYLVGIDSYFCSHRLPLAVAARKAGFDVSVATAVTTHGEEITEAGLTLIPLKHLSRGRASIFQNLRALFEIYKVFRKVKPDVVHDVAMKPVLFGAIAGSFAHVPHMVHALGGMGYLFISQSLGARITRFIVESLWRIFLRGNHQKMIVQNSDDMDIFVKNGILPASSMVLIPGSGVNLEHFKPSGVSNEIPVFVCAARMLWDKGIGELVEAARLLQAEGLQFHMVLCGGLDKENPAGIAEEKLLAWNQEGVVEWIGHRTDMAVVYQQADVAVLPSYREGMPKSLLEAAACGLPIVTTDVPGCQEVVPKGTNGILVPAHEVESLAAALKFYILNPARRKSHGMNSRRIAEKSFSEEIVIKQTLKLYLVDDSGK
jgi:glycosyltransferase involved in cell wall biosynthesis